ncbi:MAG: sugar transferase, partial [Bacteriovoracales bacterium]
MDIVGGLVGIIMFSPLLLAVAAAIKLDSKGPVMADTPMRVGKNGKLFKMFKFRSMVVGAQDLLQKNPELLKDFEKPGRNLTQVEILQLAFFHSLHAKHVPSTKYFSRELAK